MFLKLDRKITMRTGLKYTDEYGYIFTKNSSSTNGEHKHAYAQDKIITCMLYKVFDSVILMNVSLILSKSLGREVQCRSSIFSQKHFCLVYFISEKFRKNRLSLPEVIVLKRTINHRNSRMYVIKKFCGAKIISSTTELFSCFVFIKVITFQWTVLCRKKINNIYKSKLEITFAPDKI